MVGKPGSPARTRRRGQTRLLAGLSAVAAGLLLFYFGRESSAGATIPPVCPDLEPFKVSVSSTFVVRRLLTLV